ncbi:MAG: hypothetical protein CYPHOPRED_005508 [Cyphobasidiales sp. Tagirdzhanova-0007]|nr:MAG: hypothetical protein CYPHOPRED_005508 [Cyphobasidiales sp. Tagirdzhanova-0007]
MTVLNIHAGGAHAFSLKHKETDTAATIKSRAGKKLQIQDPLAVSALYEWHLVRYALDDEDDYEIFQSRVSSLPEVSIFLSGEGVKQAEKQPLPGTRPHTFSPSMVSAIEGRTGSSTSYDSQSLYSSNTNSRSGASKAMSIHLIATSDSADNDNDTATVGGKSTKSVRTLAERAAASGVPVHKLAFNEFHNQLGVRTFIGSIGPIENMKPGHRHCYMAREFALQHGFIPKDAAPGFYGFSGITNLGSWPIRVGGKTVELQVMLVENSYFPVILGRSFMEKRQVQTNPLDQTHVIFQDNSETVPCDIVVVKDANGNPIPIS